MRVSPSCSLTPHPFVPATPGRPSLTFRAPAAQPLQPARRGVPAGVARRERRLLLFFVALAHAAGATLLARVDTTTDPVLDTPITVALIQPVSFGPETTAEPEPPAPEVTPAVTPPLPEPPPPLPAAVEPPPLPPVALPEPPPPPVVQPEPPPPPVATPEPPKPRPQPAPRKEEVKPAPKPPVEPRPAAESRPTVEASAPVAEPPRPQPNPAPTAAARPAPSPAAQVTAARFDAAYLNNPPPAYPRVSRRMREEGRVLLRVFVTSEGRAGRIELSESSGSSRLDQAAEAAVASWRFVPAKQGERAIDAWVIVPIVFKLEG